jgi:hypothetical protein
MKLKPLHLCVLLAIASSLLSSCSMSGDAVNPTITEMDRLDVKWGLEPRKTKGSTARKSLPTQTQLNMPPPEQPAYNPAPAPSAPAPAPQPTPITVDPSKINTLR